MIRLCLAAALLALGGCSSPVGGISSSAPSHDVPHDEERSAPLAPLDGVGTHTFVADDTAGTSLATVTFTLLLDRVAECGTDETHAPPSTTRIAARIEVRGHDVTPGDFAVGVAPAHAAISVIRRDERSGDHLVGSPSHETGTITITAIDATHVAGSFTVAFDAASIPLSNDFDVSLCH